MSANAKISGSWKDVSDIQAKVSGAWKPVDTGYSKISGVWKQFYSAVAPSASAYDLLETTILTSSASSVSFTGLGSYTDYKHLQIRSLAAGSGSSFDEITLTFNSDTSSTYRNHFLFGNGSSVSSGDATDRRIASITSSTSSVDIFGAAVIDILDFSSTTKNTTARGFSGYTAATQDRVFLRSLLYVNTDAIISILIENNDSTNFQAGSRFSLYGIKDS